MVANSIPTTDHLITLRCATTTLFVLSICLDELRNRLDGRRRWTCNTLCHGSLASSSIEHTFRMSRNHDSITWNVRPLSKPFSLSSASASLSSDGKHVSAALEQHVLPADGMRRDGTTPTSSYCALNPQASHVMMCHVHDTTADGPPTTSDDT